jgi:hypothetical protein
MVLAHPVTPYLFTSLIGLAYLRRIVGNFGRRPWRPVRTGIRLGLLSLALLGLLMAAVFVPGAGFAVGLGIAAGGTLAGFALRHNHAEVVAGVAGYTPNPWIGGLLSLLLVGRLLWRMTQVDMSAMAASGAGFGQQASPLTLGIAATLVSFYVVNSIGLFVQMRRLLASAQTPFIQS